LILVDSSIWIDADREPDSPANSELVALIRQDEVAYTEVVMAEVLQGAPTEAKFRDLLDKMTALHFFPADRRTWLDAAQLSFRLRRRGLATPLADLVIAQVALENGLTVYASDGHFGRVDGLALHAPSEYTGR
jgi:predicted nucleic acid-binding protein